MPYIDDNYDFFKKRFYVLLMITDRSPTQTIKYKNMFEMIWQLFGFEAINQLVSFCVLPKLTNNRLDYFSTDNEHMLVKFKLFCEYPILVLDREKYKSLG